MFNLFIIYWGIKYIFGFKKVWTVNNKLYTEWSILKLKETTSESKMKDFNSNKTSNKLLTSLKPRWTISYDKLTCYKILTLVQSLGFKLRKAMRIYHRRSISTVCRDQTIKIFVIMPRQEVEVIIMWDKARQGTEELILDQVLADYRILS